MEGKSTILQAAHSVLTEEMKPLIAAFPGRVNIREIQCLAKKVRARLH
jgi:hypothetical protein